MAAGAIVVNDRRHVFREGRRLGCGSGTCREGENDGGEACLSAGIIPGGKGMSDNCSVAKQSRRIEKQTKAPAQKPKAKGTCVDQRIRELGGWRGDTLARMRALILEADPDMTEEWKWSNPVWSHDGIVCTGEAYTKVVKLTFAQGAKIPDPSRLFNSSLEGNT